MDKQIVEILGRNRLIDELISDDIEVGFPARDRGIDLIAYIDLKAKSRRFIAVPIQLKAAAKRGFAIDRKYAKIADLLLVYVWGLGVPESIEIYALSYDEALAVARKMRWTATDSWKKRGRYSNGKPGKDLLRHIEPFRICRGAWAKRIRGNQRRRSGSAAKRLEQRY